MILNEFVPALEIPTTPAVEVTDTEVCGCVAGILILNELVPALEIPTAPTVDVTETDV